MKKNDLRKLFSYADWNDETIEEADKIVSRIASEYLGLSTYPNQFEIISSEQMLDAYSLIGLPISYNHWKFGKDFVMNQNQYKKGKMGLAYELVINSNPCISYNMEDNTTCLMILVLAHAAYGHNHFFKNNYLFKQWTQADSIVDYMVFAKNYIAKCEEKYGYEEVEMVLDACHALMNYGVDKYKKPRKLSPSEEYERLKKKIEDDRVLLNDIWRTIPKEPEKKSKKQRFPDQPEENILYFIEKNSPKLKEWQREIVRIVRKISQYFYPQVQTKVINEGCLVEGSLISTEDGLLDIKYIVENKYSGKVWDGEKWESIYDWFTNTNKDRIKIITNKGYEIHGGFDHRVLVNDNWIKLSEIKIGDKISISPIKNHIWPKYDPFIKMDNDNTKYWKEKEAFDLFEIPFFPKIMNKELAAWLGYLVGDGKVSVKNRIICLTSGDYEQIERFEKLTKFIFGDHICVNIKKEDKEDNKWRAIINNLNIIEFILKYLDIKIGKSSSIKEIPHLIFKSSKETIVEFIRSYFDCDGCVVTKSGSCILVSNSKKLVSGVQELLLYFDIFSSFRIQKDDTYNLNISGINALYFRDRIGFGLKRKQDRLSILDKNINDKTWFLKRKIECIVEKIEIDNGTTYDFSVSNSHKYYHKGIINHNCATFTHYEIINKMYEEGYLSDGFMLEFMHHHSNVIFQPGFDSKYYSGLNPYTLGFNIFNDLKRISLNPTDEDKKWFPDIAGNPNWQETFRYIVENFKDETFILQYLSPKVIRDMRLFLIDDIQSSDTYEVTAIHNDRGYKKIRESLSEFYNRSRYVPDIQVYNVDIYGDRTLTLEYTPINNKDLDIKELDKVLAYVKYLWGFPVKIIKKENGKKHVISSTN